MSSYVWVCLRNKSAKIWGYDIYAPTAEKLEKEPTALTEVVYYWGSIGRPMQALTKINVGYSNLWSARDTVKKSIDDKERKGYMRMKNHLYFQAVDDFLDELTGLIDDAQTI